MFAEYAKVCERCVADGTQFSSFKFIPEYTSILEHVPVEKGIEYLENIRRLQKYSEVTLKEYCQANDKVGSGHKHDFGFGATSPSNLRYAFQANLVLEHMVKVGMTNDVPIIEIGGGYGGFCLAINYFAPLYGVTISKYSLIDLLPAAQLQEKYLSHHTLSFATSFHDSEKSGGDVPTSNAFLISNYAFSSFSFAYQYRYINMLFPKVSHGFMVWTYIPVYNFGFTLASNVEEFPLTSPSGFNRYLFF